MTAKELATQTGISLAAAKKRLQRERQGQGTAAGRQEGQLTTVDSGDTKGTGDIQPIRGQYGDRSGTKGTFEGTECGGQVVGTVTPNHAVVSRAEFESLLTQLIALKGRVEALEALRVAPGRNVANPSFAGHKLRTVETHGSRKYDYRDSQEIPDDMPSWDIRDS